MATKFSDFTAQAATGTTFVVGYDGTTNTQYSQDNLTNFVLDGTLSANRLLNFNSNTLQLGNQGTDGGGVKIFQDGRIEIARQSGSFKVTSYGTQLRQNFLRLYSNTTLGATVTGFATLAASSNWTDGGTGGDGFNINARLGVIGVHNDNTSYAFRVQNSDNDELMQVRNDGVIAIGKGATLPNNSTSTVIGTSASANGNGTAIGNYARALGGGATVLGSYSTAAGSYSVAIGYDTDVAAVTSSIGIGANANVGAANSINIDASGNSSSSNNDAGTLKVHLTSHTTPSFQVDAANGMTPPTFSSNPSSPSAGNVIYNTSDNKLKFYNGTDWTDAGGGGDNIYTADGTLSGNRDVDLATYNLGFTNGKIGIGTSSPLYTLDTKGTIAGNWLARVQNDSGTGHGLQVKVDSNSSGKVTFATKNSIGYTMTVHNNGNVAIGKNNLTGPSARLHIKGAGLTAGTTAFLVEDSSGNDIMKALDDRSIGLGYNATQITTDSTSGGNVWLRNTTGSPLFSVGVVSGATGKINVYGGFYNTFEYGSGRGLVFTNEAGFNVSQDLSSMLTCVSVTKGFLPPRMTTTQRDAINSGTFTTGLTLYNTTDNKLQFYNGTAWTDASGGTDTNIYNTDGTISDLTRTISVPQNGNIYFSPSTAGQGFAYYIGDNYISSFGEIRIPQAGRFKVTSFNTELRRNFLKLYGGAGPCLNGTVDGFLTISSFGNGDPSAIYSINARLGVVGKSATSTTDYAFRVQDSAAADMLTVRDDGAFSLGKGANTTTSTGIAIGANASSTAASGIAIGAMTSHVTTAGLHSIAMGGSTRAAGSYSVAIGYNCGNNSTSVNSCVNIGSSAQGDGANSITLSATDAGDVVPSTAKAFGVYMSSNTTPDFKIAHDGNSYITGTGNFGFGDGNTSPTATVDIDGTFRLRSATNVSGKVLTADANGNGTWQTASGGSAGQNLLAITSITGSGGSQVSHDIKVYSNTTSNNFSAINFNSDETERYAKIVFTPTGTVAKVVFRALGEDVGGTGEAWLGLHSSSSQTASPAYGWFLINKDAESGEYEHITAEWLLTGLTANQQITAYVMGISSSPGSTFYARELNTGAWNSTSDTTAFPVTVEAYDVSATVTSNPSS